MKKTFIILFAAHLLMFCGCGQKTVDEQISKTINMKISSSAYAENGSIPSKYTCDGENVNPPFIFEEIPEGTKSLAIIYDDPDAPTGTWIHWVVWNINPENPKIDENSVPAGATLGINDFGQTAYGGPCPPSGTHRYVLKAYSVDTMIQLASGSSKKDLLSAIQGHILAENSFTGVYSRK